jgi:putative endonuclease
MSLIPRVFGRKAESEAERYLRRNGYRILQRNARSWFGELDLVAQIGQVLVFVEVKARRTSAFGGAAYAVHTRKQDKLVKLAANYLARYGLQDRTCRFDVLLCTERRTGRLEIEHIEHAFEVPADELQC